MKDRHNGYIMTMIVDTMYIIYSDNQAQTQWLYSDNETQTQWQYIVNETQTQGLPCDPGAQTRWQYSDNEA